MKELLLRLEIIMNENLICSKNKHLEAQHLIEQIAQRAEQLEKKPEAK